MILRNRQKTFVERSLAALKKHQNTLGVAPTGCHAQGTLILLLDGTIKPVENIQAGDQLMGPDSQPRTVLTLHRGQDRLYEIRPLKGEPFVVNAGHILSLVKTHESRDQNRTTTPSIVNISVSAYVEQSAHFKHLHKLYRARVDFPKSRRPTLEPYFLGLLLGDGSLKYGTPAITTADFEVVDYCYGAAQHYGVTLRQDQLADNEANTYYFKGDPSYKHNPLKRLLQNLDVWGKGSDDKFIPHHYKTGSRDTRAAILAGLIDSDGYLHKNCIEFSTASLPLANDVAFVARSLGFFALPKPKKVKGKTYYRFIISGDFSDIPIRVARREPGPRRQKKNPLRTGFTVHALDWGNYYGFSLDGDHLYLTGDFTVHHNSGKTIMLSGLTGRWLDQHDQAKACVLAHRDELTTQNQTKFLRVNPNVSTSIVNATEKSWQGQTTFAMVQTLSRTSNLKTLPTLDLLIIDEAHHAVSDSYRRVIDVAHDRNPDMAVYGVTATPSRGDKKGLRPVFSNVSDHITIGELIQSGHLVRPKAFVIDVGTQEALSTVQRIGHEFDASAVDAILNKTLITESVILHWKDKAGARPTIIFCSTVQHAKDVAKAFQHAGIPTECLHGELSHPERQAALARYESGASQVIVNVAVLTEGYDYPPTSCIVLLRLSSYPSTLMQMIGRGLRTVDPKDYPGVIKTDCIVLDFGISINNLMGGSLEQAIDLDGREASGDAPQKTCPDCEASVPLGCRECPLCGYLWLKDQAPKDDEGELSDFVMSEVDLLQRSAFRWTDLFHDETSLFATGFDAWAGSFFLDHGWYSVGGGHAQTVRLLATGDRTICLAAADDWLNEHETEDGAKRSKRWLSQPATNQQLKCLPSHKNHFGLTRYHASCLMVFRRHRHLIKRIIFNAAKQKDKAA